MLDLLALLRSVIVQVLMCEAFHRLIAWIDKVAGEDAARDLADRGSQQ